MTNVNTKSTYSKLCALRKRVDNLEYMQTNTEHAIRTLFQDDKRIVEWIQAFRAKEAPKA